LGHIGPEIVVSFMPNQVLIIGCGNIAGGFDQRTTTSQWPLTQAGAFLRHGGFELAACVDPNVRARDFFAESWQVDRTAADIASLRAVPGEFDVVSICSPTDLHCEHIESALALRPRVIFCEKPISLSEHLSERTVQACQEQGVCLVVNYTRQWDPSVARLVRDVQQGEWGRIRSAAGFYNKGVFNNGSHLIDLLHRILGPLRVLAATAPTYDFWDNDPTVAGLLVSVENNVPVSLNPAHASDYAMFELELICERGTIRMCDGGMHWSKRYSEPDQRFSGYRTLVMGGDFDGGYLQAMTLAVGQINEFLLHGHPVNSGGANALAVQKICTRLFIAATQSTRDITQ